MNILVTGSRGFLGTALCKRLRADGHRVIGWDLAHSAEPDEYRVDVTNWREIQCNNDVTYFNVVVHLAAEFGRKNGDYYNERMWHAATIGTRNVVEVAKQNNAKLIFASSSEAYGDLADKYDRLSEDLLEREVPKFHNEYALSKWTGEQQVKMALPEDKRLILRIFNVYGPTEPKHSYRSFIAQLLSGERIPIYKGERGWLYISDFVDAVCLLIEKQATGVYNVGNPFSFSNHGIAADVCGEDVEVLDSPERGNVSRKVPDVSKLVALGWSHRVSVHEGVDNCLSASSCRTGTEVFSST